MVWDDGGGEWYYYCVMWCDVRTKPAIVVVYTEHMRTHTKEKPFLCDVDGCGFKTGDSSSLTRKSCGCGCED